MSMNRRSAIGSLAAGATILLRTRQSAGQGAGGRMAEQRLLRSIENAPWIATQPEAKRVAYVLWAPWCPYCLQVMKDVVAGSLPDLQLRWIGGSPRNPAQAQLLAQIVKDGSSGYLTKAVLRESVPDVAVTPEFVQRVAAADLLYFVLNKEKQSRGYPTFAYFDGAGIRTSSGYGGPHSAAAVRSGSAGSSTARPQIAYLDEPWKDLGPATGRPHQSSGEYTIYSLPSESSVAVDIIRKGYVWPEPLKRYIGVGKEKWASVSTGVSFGSGPKMNGYVRIA